VFCVFSGAGVIGLRNFLNTKDEFAEYRDGPLRTSPRLRARATAAVEVGQQPAQDAEGFEEGYALEDDDMGDGSDLIDFRNGDDLTNLAHNPVPPPPPIHHASTANLAPQPNGQSQALPPVDGTALDATLTQPHPSLPINQAMLAGHATTAAGPSTAGPSTAGPSTAGSGSLDNSTSAPGPSIAPMQGNLDNGDEQTP